MAYATDYRHTSLHDMQQHLRDMTARTEDLNFEVRLEIRRLEAISRRQAEHEETHPSVFLYRRLLEKAEKALEGMQNAAATALDKSYNLR